MLPPVEFSGAVTNLFNENDPSGFYFVTWRGGEVMKRSANSPVTVQRPEIPTRDTITYTRTRGSVREAYQSTERGDIVLAGRSVLLQQAGARKFAGMLIAGGLVVVALGLGAAWRFIASALRPVKHISETATRIADGNLSDRINVAETDSELGQLAGTLNSTFARLEQSFARQRQFVADAAHELRTPLAVMISEAQLALARERNAADYKDSLAANLEAAQQLRRLSESLLQLAQHDAGPALANRESFELASVVTICVKRLQPLADARKISIKLDLNDANAVGDPERISQVVTNLLDNAIRYNRDNGEIRICLRREKDALVLTLTDTGIGISPEDLPRVFERFYRADKSRSGTGNAGLGLSICKAIVESHDGTIEAASDSVSGTTFTVRLPSA